MAVQSFADAAVERFFHQGRLPKGVGWANVAKIVARKLDMLHYAGVLADLASATGKSARVAEG